MNISTGNVRHEQVMTLLLSHHNDMLKHSPAKSVHALDLSALEGPDITFFSGWINDKLAGVGALKALDVSHGEIKSMRTSPNFLRQGIARQLLQSIVEQANKRGYQQLSLETGTADAFKPAQRLYQDIGFVECEPFSNYEEDPYSLFMTKRFNNASHEPSLRKDK